MKKTIYCLLLSALVLSACQKELGGDFNPSVSVLKTDKSTQSLSGTSGSKDSFAIQSNINWVITIVPSSADWLQVNKTSGKGNATVYVAALKDNGADSIQKATVIISPVNDTTVKPVVIDVTQAKGTLTKDTSRNAYGGTAADEFDAVLPVAGGGFIALGTTVSKNGDVTGNRIWEDFWVVKVDASGKVVWQKTYGGSDRDFGYKMIAAQGSSGYIIVGAGASADGDMTGSHGDYDTWVAKIDDNGTIIWKKMFGGSGGDGLYDISATSDGGYILAGQTSSNDGDATGNHGGNDGWVVKIDGSGNKTWSKVLGGTGYDILDAVVQTADGGYIVGGQSQSNNGDVSGSHGYDDAWAVKLDASGNKVWQKAYGGTGYDAIASIVSSGDGGYILAGVSDSGDGDVTGNHGGQDGWVIKIDGSGNKTWQKTYGGSNMDFIRTLIKVSDGFILAGDTRSTDIDPTNFKGGLTDGWVVKIDGSGNQSAQKLLGGTDEEYMYSVIETSSGNYLMAGITFSNDKDVIGLHGDGDGWLIKFKL